MCRGLILEFCVDEDCLLLYVERIWLPQDDMTVDVDIRGKWQIFVWSLECCFIADEENCCREMLVGDTPEAQKPWFMI